MDRLPPDVQARILNLAAPDELVPRIAELIEDIKIQQAYADMHKRHVEDYERIQDTAEPKSAMDLDLQTNAHKGLYTGAQRFIDHHKGLAEEHEQVRDDLKFNLNTAKSIYYQHQLMINRARNAQHPLI